MKLKNTSQSTVLTNNVVLVINFFKYLIMHFTLFSGLYEKTSLTGVGKDLEKIALTAAAAHRWGTERQTAVRQDEDEKKNPKR